jgi:hypothetical protein
MEREVFYSSPVSSVDVMLSWLHHGSQEKCDVQELEGCHCHRDCDAVGDGTADERFDQLLKHLDLFRD